MSLPGPFGPLSLVLSLVLAGPPAIMGVLALARGDVAIGAIFLGLAVLMVVLPEYILRRIPGPTEMIKRRLPWRRSE